MVAMLLTLACFMPLLLMGWIFFEQIIQKKPGNPTAITSLIGTQLALGLCARYGAHATSRWDSIYAIGVAVGLLAMMAGVWISRGYRPVDLQLPKN